MFCLFPSKAFPIAQATGKETYRLVCNHGITFCDTLPIWPYLSNTIGVAYWLVQRCRQDFINGIDQNEFHLLAYGLRHIIEIGLIVLWQDHRFETEACSRQDF